MHFGLTSVVGSLSSVLAITTATPPTARSTSHSVQEPLSVTRPPVPGAPAGVAAFVNVTVVPMDTERALPDQTVLVQNGRITALGPATKVPVPATATRIDGQGKYLIPGLADMHVHTSGTAGLEWGLFYYVAQGVTTIRNMDRIQQTPHPPEKVLELQARVAAGTMWSPRIYTSGHWPGVHRSPTDVLPESVATYLTAYQAAGYNHLKPYTEKGTLFDSLMAAARRLKLPVAGHVPKDVTIEHALATGAYRSIEHLTGWREATDTLLARPLAAALQRAGVWSCPTLVVSYRGWGDKRRHFQVMIKAIQDAGAGLLLGTDMSVSKWRDYKLPQVSVHQELEVLVEAGLTPYQALATGTRNVAQYFGTLDESGTVAVGKRADLVLLRGNPLTDIRNTAEPAGVMLGGRWLPRTDIDRRLAEIRKAIATAP